MSLEILFLGTGTSHGVPMIGCNCPVCTSQDPRDRRNRASILIRTGDTRLLVDTPPELRLSCIRFGVSHVSAILFTHHHADHIMGLDDVRRFNHLNHDAMVCRGAPETLSEIRRTFRYAFGTAHIGGGIPALSPRAFQDGMFSEQGVEIESLPVLHGHTVVHGFRIGLFAYLTDVKTIPEHTRERLRGLDTLVLGVLRYRTHPTHLSVDEAMELLEDIRPRRTFFTHIAHDLGHAQTEDSLPADVRLAYDGLRLSVPEP